MVKKTNQKQKKKRKERTNENMKKWWKTRKMKKKSRNMKNNEEKWWKLHKNGERKNDEKMMNKKVWRKLASHAKSSTISRVYRYFCLFFRRNPRRFPCFVRNVFSLRKSTTNFGWSTFFQRKVTNFIERETKHTFYKRKSTKNKFAEVSFSNNDILSEWLTIQQQTTNNMHQTPNTQHHNNNNTISGGSVF